MPAGLSGRVWPTGHQGRGERVFDAAEVDESLTVTEVRELGPNAAVVLAINHCTLKLKASAEDEKFVFRGFWLFEQEEGDWKVKRQIWNRKPA